MAGENIVGILRIVLGMDTATLEDGIKKAQARLQQFGDNVKAVFSGNLLARGVERIFDNITHAIKSTTVEAFKFADDMGKMAQKVGISVEELTALRVASELSDVSMESLSAGLGKLSKSMVGAAEGNKELRDEFSKLGINVRDDSGHLKSAIDVLTEMADKFQGTEDGAVKVNSALKLLGRGGKDLIPLLNEGGASLKEFTEISKNMGLVIEGDTSKKVQDFNDNLKIIQLATHGVANLVVKELIPIFGNLAKSWADTAKKGDIIKDTAETISTGIKQMILTIIISIEVLKFLRKAFDEWAESTKAVEEENYNLYNDALVPLYNWFKKNVDAANEFGLKMGEVAGTVSPLREGVRGLTDNFDGMGAAANKVAVEMLANAQAQNSFTGRLQATIEAARAFWAELQKVQTEAGKTKKSSDEIVDKKVSEELEKLALQTRVLLGNFDALAPGFAEAAARLGLTDGAAKNLSTTTAGLTKEQTKLNEAFLLSDFGKLYKDALPPSLEFEQQARRVQEVIAKYPELADKAAVVVASMSRKMAESVGGSIASISGSLSDLTQTFAKENKAIGVASKAFAITQAVINTYLGASKALTTTPLPPPAPQLAAAAIIASGLAMVAKIVSQPAFAQGGSFIVPGGISGVDTTTIPLSLAAGERVDITPAGEANRGVGGGPQEVVLRGVRGRDLFTGDMLRDLFDTLNAGMADGYKLKVAT